jgi:hypothetical protein
MSTTIREYLISFIRNSISEDDYEYGLYHVDDNDTFKSYEQFIDHNKNVLNDMSDEDVKFLRELSYKIEYEKVEMVDEERIHGIEYASGFYFNKHKILVLVSLGEDRNDASIKNFYKKFDEFRRKNKILMSMGKTFSEWDVEYCTSTNRGTLYISHPR